MQIGTNVLGHHHFTNLLLPALFSATTASGEKARVVFTSSSGAYFASSLHLDAYAEGPIRRKRSTEQMYLESKFVGRTMPWSYVRSVLFNKPDFRIMPYKPTSSGAAMVTGLFRWRSTPATWRASYSATYLGGRTGSSYARLLLLTYFNLALTLSFPQKKTLLYPVHYGAITQLWGGTSPAGAELNGKVCCVFWKQ
jgi:hypothetical protein